MLNNFFTSSGMESAVLGIYQKSDLPFACDSSAYYIKSHRAFAYRLYPLQSSSYWI